MGRRYTPFDPFERSPFTGSEFTIPRPPRRFWIGLGFFALALLVVALSNPLITLWTETQWFQGLGLRDVYVTRIQIQAWLFTGSLLAAFLFAAANVTVAVRNRAGGQLRAVGIRRAAVPTGVGLAGLGASALVALILSAGVGRQWQDLVLFSHYADSGTREPLFGLDISFYLLQLPFLHDIVNWLLGLFFMTALLVAAAYAWRGDTFDLNLPPRAIAHLSVVLGLIAFTLAGSAFLGRYDLLFNHNGVVFGAGYADVNARLPVANVRAVLSVLLGLALLANVVVRRYTIPIAVGALWALATVIGAVYPSAVQGVVVKPAELTQERPYIQNEIHYTRQAYGIDINAPNIKQFQGDTPLTAKDVADDQATIDNLRLWDFRPLLDTYSQLQTIRTYYAFHDIDLDRYRIDGKYQQLEVSARELDSSRLPSQAQTWVNQKLVYTHGYSVAASPVSAVTTEGLPEYVAGDIPTTGKLAVEQPDLYFGELAKTDDYVIGNSAQKEFDYPSQTGDNKTVSYAGTHGVPMDGTARTLWSLRLGDFNLLVSSQVTPQSQMLYRRNIADRVSAIAPFLQFDGDPYIVVADGRLYWVIDGYTTASTYPYSQSTDDGNDTNYIRNSVKVVVDAYEGTATFYVNDPKDPLIRAYQGAFPSLFTPIDRMPASLRAHVRVPEGLFKYQTAIYRTYHITDPQVFYNREDVWDFPIEQTGPNANQPLEPYYVMMRLPGEAQAEYLLIQPFTPRGKQNMVAWLAVRNDAPNYGQAVVFELPKDRTIFGPQQVAALIQNTPEYSRDVSLLNQQGSSVVQGNLLVVPIGSTFIYFQPIYLKSSQTQTIPELKRVILVHRDQVVYSTSLEEALNVLLGGAAGQPPTTSPPPVNTNQTVQQLAQQALQHYNAAQAALRNGDLATYAKEMDQVAQILQQIVAATGGTTTPSPPPGASPSPRASPTPSR
jgi:uncharacterized membrane protein (UPF0182 family)